MPSGYNCNAADRALQLQHARCATYRAAGINPPTAMRCPTGAELWATYQAAGMPTHFTWQRQGGRNP